MRFAPETVQKVMDALSDKKYGTPYDYSVCGCDNTVISQYRTISMNFDAIRRREAEDMVSIHVESTRHLQKALSKIRQRGAKASAALNRQF